MSKSYEELHDRITKLEADLKAAQDEVAALKVAGKAAISEVVAEATLQIKTLGERAVAAEADLKTARQSARTGWESARSLAVAYAGPATERAAVKALKALDAVEPDAAAEAIRVQMRRVTGVLAEMHPSGMAIILVEKEDLPRLLPLGRQVAIVDADEPVKATGAPCRHGKTGECHDCLVDANA